MATTQPSITDGDGDIRAAISDAKGAAAASKGQTEGVGRLTSDFLIRQAKRIQRAESGVVAFEREAIHEMRVASRRARSALRLFGGLYDEDARDEVMRILRKLGRSLGALRDVDLWSESLATFQEEHPSADVSAIQCYWAELQLRQKERILKLIEVGTARVAAECIRVLVEKHEDGTDSLSAEQILSNQFGQVRSRARGVKGANLKELHRLRIEAKRLRYAVELLMGPKNSQTKSLVKPLVVVQDHLGLIQEDRAARNDLRENDLDKNPVFGFLQMRIAQRRQETPAIVEPILTPEFRIGLLEATCGSNPKSEA